MQLPVEFLAGLDRVVVAWSQFEHNLGNVTMNLITPDIYTAISVVKELRFRALANAALNVYRAHIGEDSGFEALSAIIKRAEELEPHRNQLVHARYQLAGPDRTKVALFKIAAKRKGIKRVSKFIEIQYLESLADNIQQLSNDLLALYQRLVEQGKTKYVRITQ
jgi:hypothetical protein